MRSVEIRHKKAYKTQYLQFNPFIDWLRAQPLHWLTTGREFEDRFLWHFLQIITVRWLMVIDWFV